MPAMRQGILIVEDDNVIRESLSEVLADEGYTVVTARHGGEALSLLKAGGLPCVILLDLMMPVMDGWELLEIMQQDATLSTIPVVVVSASREKRQPRGAVRFIRKPINLEILLQEVGLHCPEKAATVASRL
jgi:CheY-like chemotaxis protein